MLDLLRPRTGCLMVAGHRGARGYAPENTMPSFIKAHECGADTIEFDVHLTKDKRCVIIHDEELERTTDGHGLVQDYTWAELSKLDAGSWFDRKSQATLEALAKKEGKFADPNYIPPPIPTQSFAGTRLPLLEETLEWAKAVGIGASIEIKVPFPFYSGTFADNEIIDRTLEIVARYGDEENTQIHSFDHRLMRRVKELNPNISTTISFYGAIMVNPLSLLDDALADGVAIGSIWVTRELVDIYHAHGRTVFAWGGPGEDPYNEEAELGKLVQMGVDYVSGGLPDLLREVAEKYV
ncbi:MAG: hypothetical protein HXX08_24170 [Chloroflexi bacterium]|uniref:GP-PDE domain-containing protein n=1 Tax=Candidatus Chlorohelix allophototropha TaxID=3003348 RepID=A0A8T7MA16_9CHLR|nr:hypothetical protein [Chloroflexota bacterium]WJW68898.1 hypothetical protein OZ401_004520 [Chloroflexota bacterium L227-S17]